VVPATASCPSKSMIAWPEATGMDAASKAPAIEVDANT